MHIEVCKRRTCAGTCDVREPLQVAGIGRGVCEEKGRWFAHVRRASEGGGQHLVQADVPKKLQIFEERECAGENPEMFREG